MTVSDYSIQANSNSRISGINIAENCPPSSLNNGLRQLMADLRLLANDAGWFAFGSGDGGVRASLERASNGDILLNGGDFTTSYTANRRVRLKQLPSSFYYGTIVSSSFAVGGATTVKVNWDTGVTPSAPYDSLALGLDPSSCSGSAILPPSTVLFLATTTVPAGFLAANGQAVSRASYPALF
ncbi:MAG: tail fiber protein, partial [Alphaproteobacteria bacterium]|nr:tail fiber protein [Alphaproteobacteria bacterium]